MTKKDGKNLEVKVSDNFIVVRLYDTRSAKGGYIPPQPADFVVPKEFIECKHTDKLFILKSNFSKKQIAMQMYYYNTFGIETFYIIEFGDGRIFRVPFSYIYAWFKSKNGKIYPHDLNPEWEIGLE